MVAVTTISDVAPVVTVPVYDVTVVKFVNIKVLVDVKLELSEVYVIVPVVV